VPVAILERRLEKATSQKEKMKIEMKLMALLQVSASRIRMIHND
jgi:hypothetical protein